MNIGSRGLSIIKQCEQCRLTAFKPTPTDRWTIGWGRSHGVNEFDTCTQEQADQWLLEDVAEAEAGVNKLVTHPVNQAQFDALVSFAYNVGLDIDADTKAEGLGDSTLLKKVNAGDFVGAAAEFPKWNKEGGVVRNGLVKRREMERTLFESPL